MSLKVQIIAYNLKHPNRPPFKTSAVFYFGVETTKGRKKILQGAFGFCEKKFIGYKNIGVFIEVY